MLLKKLAINVQSRMWLNMKILKKRAISRINYLIKILINRDGLFDPLEKMPLLKTGLEPVLE